MAEATRLSYIGVWILAAVLTAIAQTVVQLLFAHVLFFKNIITIDFEAGLALLYAIFFVVQFLIWLYTYKSFPMLNYAKVIPYLWFFAILGAISVFMVNAPFKFSFAFATAGMAILSCGFLTDQLRRYEEAKDINATAAD